MPLWAGREFETVEQGKFWWKQANLDDMKKIMGISTSKRLAWLSVATQMVTPKSTVLELGCGEGLMVETLPDSTAYLGVDLNEGYVEYAKQKYSDRPYTTFKVMDLYDVLESDMRFDYTICTSLFGVFPEAETYSIMSKLWDKTDKTMSITTLNKKKYHSRKSRLTSHEPAELLKFLSELPDVESSYLQETFPKEVHTIHRAMWAYASRERVVYRKYEDGPVYW